MADLTQSPSSARGIWNSLNSVWTVIVLIPILLAIFDPAQLMPTLGFTAQAFGKTLIFISFAVAAIGFLKATGAESILAEAFKGNQVRMVVLAALLGGLSPFCSCEIIPFIAALLAAGVPLAPVMAFWLSSPLMDPAMFLMTGGTLGMDFAIAKTIAAVGLGLFGGFSVMLLSKSFLFTEPLRTETNFNSCGCRSPFKGQPVWRFWGEAKRVKIFKDVVLENLLFLGKWLLLAYLLESLMLAYVPAEWISGILGGDGFSPIALGALVGAPAYLNGYAAVALIGGLLSQGMSNGAAMSFMIAGGVSSIPAAIAVWALVKPKVFGAYLGLALIGSMTAGSVWSIVA